MNPPELFKGIKYVWIPWVTLTQGRNWNIQPRDYTAYFIPANCSMNHNRGTSLPTGHFCEGCPRVTCCDCASQIQQHKRCPRSIVLGISSTAIQIRVMVIMKVWTWHQSSLYFLSGSNFLKIHGAPYEIWQIIFFSSSFFGTLKVVKLQARKISF